MTITVVVPRERAAGERRVAIEPSVASRMAKQDVQVLIEKGAGDAAKIPDTDFEDAQIVEDVHDLYEQADVILKVGAPTDEEIDQFRQGSILISFIMPHLKPQQVAKLRDKHITSFAMELIPRISRAQNMDALSSQASIAGYKAAIMGADLANRFFPMLTTAAGTIRPAKVLVIGAGVAGLQAIATARRLGAIVEAYDVRAATKEQVESLGAKFIEFEIKAEGEGGYARELTEEEKQQQQEMLMEHIANSQIVITTAAIPGRPSPKIIPRSAVERMQKGSVIIDLAADGGGNCELTTPGETVEHNGVVIHGPINIPSQVAFHASEMYAKNLYNFLQLLIKDGAIKLDWNDQILSDSVVTHAGEIKHEATRKLVEGET